MQHLQKTQGGVGLLWLTSHLGRPPLSVTIAQLQLARRKPICPVGATTKRWFRRARMTGGLWSVRSWSGWGLATAIVLGWLCLASFPLAALAQERREREPNNAYPKPRPNLPSHPHG